MSSSPIEPKLIATHLPDMLRVVLSIKAGRMTPSTMLRKLSTYSQKNKLYQTFRELGRCIRTMFLLSYLADEDVRITISAATNKNESFNRLGKYELDSSRRPSPLDYQVFPRPVAPREQRKRTFLSLTS